MESIGFTFFETFMGHVSDLSWLLIAVFVAVVARQLWGFRPEERLQSLLMFAYFFLVITSFWVLKPLKKGLFLSFYDEMGLDLIGMHLRASHAEALAKVLNMVVALAAMIVFTILVRRFQRERLIYVLSGFFIIAFALYSQLLDGPGVATVWSFYLFGDLYSTVMVVAFFAFLNDSVDSGAAKRMYGLVVLGGLAGGVFGSSMVGVKVKEASSGSWLWLCLGMAIAIILIAMAAGRLVARQETQVASAAIEPEEESGGGNENPALEGARLALRSSYLLSVVAIVGLYEMVSTIMDFQFSDTIGHYLDGAMVRVQVSRVMSFTTWISLFVQVFLTSFIMKRSGVGAALLFLPVACLLGSLGFMVAPVLLMGSALNTCDNGFSYSINQSAKEALYVVTTRDEKYKAKAFIDMFVQRLAKAVAVGLALVITIAFSGFESVRWLSLATAVILLVWIGAARYAGRAFAARESSGPAAT